MTDTSANNKRIAKNTLLLYIRMLLTIVVGLYTSRVVLNTLGVSDYGIYNVVGGIVAMLAFLNSALTAASQRFISFELGRGDKQKLKTIFARRLQSMPFSNYHIHYSRNYRTLVCKYPS